MKTSRSRILVGVLLVASVLVVSTVSWGQAPKATTSLPTRLSDADFWKLVSDISEPGGYFRIVDNFTSNENEIGGIATELRTNGVQGGVYIGVGPEQNLTYISAIHPAMAFVIDIRRQAVMQHLMFKSVFELSKDRADFVSLLFSRPKPAGLDVNTPIQDIWNAFLRVPTDPTLAAKNHALIVDRLTKTHGFKFTEDEATQLDLVLNAFVNYGPDITTNSGSGGGVGGRGGRGGNALNFAELTGWSIDDAGQPQSFLTTNENFQTVKALEDKNLLVPVSGDFGGPKALRAIGSYVKAHDASVSAFYVSNVEQYLFMDGKDRAFYDNVATLPLNSTSVFIRPYALRPPIDSDALCPMMKFVAAAKAGHVLSNNQALACPQ
ncbi:MAG TPA: hypothetical protein VFO86_08055 [Terriglobia bacterium]|nr:hypothetical protein [Terriglobia bacterium]